MTLAEKERLECRHCGAPVDFTRPDCRWCTTVYPPGPPMFAEVRVTDYELARALALYRRGM